MLQEDPPTYDFHLKHDLVEIDPDRYVYSYEELEMGLDGRISSVYGPDLGELDPEPAPEEFTLQQLGLKVKADCPKKCEELNRGELSRAYGQLSTWTQRLTEFPESGSIIAKIKYLQFVIGRFLIWYDANGFAPPPKGGAGKEAPIEAPSGLTESALPLMDGEIPEGAHAIAIEPVVESKMAGSVPLDDGKDRTIAIQNELIKGLRHKTTALRSLKFSNKPLKDELEVLASANRKKNGSVNYLKLGKTLGIDHKTAKKWCLEYGIK